jgi:hypothetical protein
LNLKNGHVLHIGAELMAGNVPLRVGFLLEPTLSTDDKLENSLIVNDGKPNYIFGGTFGSSIPAGKYTLIEIAAQYLVKRTTRLSYEPVVGYTFKEYDTIIRNIRIDLGVKIILPSLNTNSSGSSSY